MGMDWQHKQDENTIIRKNITYWGKPHDSKNPNGKSKIHTKPGALPFNTVSLQQLHEEGMILIFKMRLEAGPR